MRGRKTFSLWGHGYVGQAVASTLSKYGHKIHLVDPPKNIPITLGAFTCDGAILCLPTPTVNGEVDHSAIVDSIKRIREVTPKLPILIKSTISPTFAKYIQEDPYITFSPEFLTAANSKEDFANSKFMVFGGKNSYYWADIMLDCMENLRNVKTTDCVSAAMMKYTINCFLATKLSFLNEVADLYVDLTGKMYDNLKDLLELDPRLGPSHMDVRGGWGGACFPKDTEAFSNMGDMLVLDAAIAANKKWNNNEDSNT